MMKDAWKNGAVRYSRERSGRFTAKDAKENQNQNQNQKKNQNQNLKPTTETRRHGEKPEKTSCTAEARRRGDAEKNLISMKNLRRKRGNLGLIISNTEARRKTQINESIFSLRGKIEFGFKLEIRNYQFQILFDPDSDAC